MRETLAKILASILRSLFVSVLMLVITLSAVTGKFPPDFGRLKTSWQNLQQLAQLGREIQAQQKNLQNHFESSEDSDAVSELESLQHRRAELGAGLLAGQAPPPSAVSPSSAFAEDRDLRLRMQELENQLYRLQQRVSELETK